MFPEPTELLLIGCLIESIWIPTFKFSTMTPKTNSQTYWPRDISHVMNGIIFVLVYQLPFQFHSVSKRCRKEHKKMQVKKESQKNRSRWWIWYQDACKGSERACLDCIRKPRENQIWKSELHLSSLMCSNQVRRDPKTNLVRLKNGNQVARWKTKESGFFWNDKKANSRWSQNWDREATNFKPILIDEVSRNWLELLALSEGKLIMILQVMNNAGKINYYFKNNYQNKIEIFVKLVSSLELRFDTI